MQNRLRAHSPSGVRLTERVGRERGYPRSIAVIGASGFLGNAALRALATNDCRITAVGRRQPQSLLPRVHYVDADITDVQSLVGVLDGVDVVIHAASYTGPIEALCKATNYIGTQNVLTAAEQCRIQYVINISTIGVYGLGPFKGVKEEDRGPRPVTALSTSKAEADYLVRSHGGITVRPGFVYGPSDRWFLPRLESILACTQTWIEDGAARLSLIDVHDLGALIAELALTCSERDQGTLFHAAHPHAQTVRDIVVNFSSGTFKSPTQSCQYSEAIARTAELGVTPREIDLVGRDHEIDSTRLWVRTGLIPGRQRLSKMRS